MFEFIWATHKADWIYLTCNVFFRLIKALTEEFQSRSEKHILNKTLISIQTNIYTNILIEGNRSASTVLAKIDFNNKRWEYKFILSDT
jgi:hypothetical protein